MGDDSREDSSRNNPLDTKLQEMYDQAFLLVRDNNVQEAWVLLRRALGYYHNELSKSLYSAEKDAGAEGLIPEIEGLIRRIERKDVFLLEERVLQAVNPDTGELINKDIKWFESHVEGHWHAACHVLILDPRGRALTRVLKDRDRKDISATTHRYKGESSEEAVLRAIRSKTGLSYPREEALTPVLLGERKIGRSDYNGKTGYDKDGIFRSRSREKYNREHCNLYIYILTPEELNEFEAVDNYMREIFMFASYNLPEIITSVASSPEKFASAAQHLFDSRNIDDVYKKTLDSLYGILSGIINGSHEAVDLNYNENIYNTSKTIIDRITDWKGTSWAKHLSEVDKAFTDKCKAKALRDIEILYQEASTLTIWRRLSMLYKNKMILDWKEIREALKLTHLLGDEARSAQGRALLHTFLRKGINIEKTSDRGFIFKYKN
jgi:hypothetical protein